jgi:predicted unusual protein kinase regulating ubiquinone biosynthesis (AarF/ABC1/UbiB family)
MLTIILLVLLGLALVAILAVMLLGRGSRIARGRFGRLAKIGRLSARLSTSRLGAAIRRRFTSKDRRAAYDEARRRADAEAVTKTMGEMKGAFMKLGQMLSFVSDDIPPEYRAALQALQAKAPPMDFALIRDVAERSLGKPLERAFARFDAEPLAAASIGQVHRARLPSGEEVVVKIQYPGVADAIRADLQNVGVLYRIAGMFYPGLDTTAAVDELKTRLIEELDYEREARNQMLFHDLYRDHPFIRVPRVFPAYSSALVLTSEYVPGRRFDDVVATASAADKSRYGEILYRFVFGSIIKLGVFNGDPHPGNYLFDDDGRIVFLDYGCIKYFPEPMMRTWRKLVAAHLDGKLERFVEAVYELDFFKRDTALPPQPVYDYFGYFYDPFRVDRDYTFTREYNAKSMEVVFKPKGEIAPLHRKMNMPRDFLLVNRIQWGVYSILAKLDATGNWYRIHREYLSGAAPSTALGRIDHDYRTRWCADRALGADLYVTPDGIRAVS